MDQTVLLIVRVAGLARGDDVLLAHRVAGDANPLLPFAGSPGLVVGVKQEVSAERASPILPVQQAKGSSAQRSGHPAAAVSPILGKVRVVHRR